MSNLTQKSQVSQKPEYSDGYFDASIGLPPKTDKLGSQSAILILKKNQRKFCYLNRELVSKHCVAPTFAMGEFFSRPYDTVPIPFLFILNRHLRNSTIL